jgi:hypothetical protein
LAIRYQRNCRRNTHRCGSRSYGQLSWLGCCSMQRLTSCWIWERAAAPTGPAGLGHGRVNSPTYRSLQGSNLCDRSNPETASHKPLAVTTETASQSTLAVTNETASQSTLAVTTEAASQSTLLMTSTRHCEGALFATEAIPRLLRKVRSQ